MRFSPFWDVTWRTFWSNLYVPYISYKISVNRHQHKPRNIPEEWRIQLHCGWSLTPRKYNCCLHCIDSNSPSYKGNTSELLRSHGCSNISTLSRVLFTRLRICEKRPLLSSYQSISPPDARVSAAPTGRISVKFGNEYVHKTLSSNSILVLYFLICYNRNKFYYFYFYTAQFLYVLLHSKHTRQSCSSFSSLKYKRV
jgi:hypothetical protein